MGLPKAYRAGTHRSVAPEETVRRAWRFAPVMGITRIGNVTGLDVVGVPVVTVTRPNSRSLAVAQGKGLTLAAAKASGLMESIESYHAETITLPLRYCSLNELRYTHRVVDPAQLPAVATSSFHSSMRLLWCEGRDLMDGGPAFVPYELVHTDYTWPQPAGSGCFAASSNGLASGNHLLEAISHAICEVVERDANSLWMLREPTDRESRQLDLTTVDDAACRQVIEKFEAAGLELSAWDMTTDIGVASFYCVIFQAADDPTRWLPPAAGAGSHPSRAIALLRALTEAAQTRLVHISGSRDDVGRDRYVRHRYRGVLDDLRGHVARPGPRNFRDAPDCDGDTFEDDVAWLLTRLREVGVNHVVAIDLTNDAFKLPVVRVVIPGLEGPHEAPGYVAGVRAQAIMASRS
jgi:YcaO-like protein with predicted kinase domain